MRIFKIRNSKFRIQTYYTYSLDANGCVESVEMREESGEWRVESDEAVPIRYTFTWRKK
jgi:hypothetical protein